MTFVATCREILDVKSSKNQGRPAGFRKHNPPEAKLVKDSGEDGALDLETGNQTGGQMRGDTSSVEVRPDNFLRCSSVMINLKFRAHVLASGCGT